MKAVVVQYAGVFASLQTELCFPSSSIRLQNLKNRQKNLSQILRVDLVSGYLESREIYANLV